MLRAVKAYVDRLYTGLTAGPQWEQRERYRELGNAQWQVILPAVLLTAVLYLPWLLIRGFEPREDALRQTVPWFKFFRDQILSGHLPVWDPSRLAGAPHLGNIQAGVLYPPNWLLLPLPPNVAAGLMLVGHIALGGIFLSLFARKLGIVPPAAALAGMACVAGGFATARTFPSHVEVLRAMAWAPLLLLAARALATEGRAVWAGCLGAGVGLSFLAGYPAVTVYSLGAAGVLFLGSLPEGSRRVRSMLLAGLGGALGLLVATPGLWPLVELAGHTLRSGGLSLEQAGQGALRPRDLPVVVWPWFFGAEPLGNFWTGRRWYWHEMQSASGVVLLALAAFGASRLRRVRWARILVLLAAGSLLLALGTLTPVYTVLHTLVPSLRSFRIPARFLLIWALVVPLLAAAGFAELLRIKDPHAHRPFRAGLFLSKLVLAIELVLIVATLVLVLKTPAGTELREHAWRRVTGSLAGAVNIGAGIGGLLLLRAAWRRRNKRGATSNPGASRKFVGMAYAAVLLELALVALPSIYGPSDSMRSVIRDLGAENLQTLRESDTRVAFHTKFTPYAGLGSVLGFQSATAYDPLLLGRTTALLRSEQPTIDFWGSATNNVLLERDGGVAFDVLGIGYMLDARPAGARLLSRERPLPRLSVVPNARTASTPQDSLAAVLAPGFDPHSEVILERSPAMLIGAPTAGDETTVEIVEARPGSLRARIHAPEGGYLVFSESYYPGWQATATGQSVPLAPADHAIMAAKLGPGAHDVTLQFTTPWLLPSLGLGGVGAVGIALLCAGSVLRRRIQRFPARR